MTPQEIQSDEIDIIEILKVLWVGKYIILLTTVIFGVASIFYAKSLPNIYKSEALLAPASEDGGGSSLSQLGGLASLAGINLSGGKSSIDKTTLAIETLKSREFLKNFIEKHKILPLLLGVKSWNKNEPIFDKTIYDQQNDKWLKNGVEFKPSILSASGTLKNLLNINIDSGSKMIRLSIEHQSPEIAKQWVTWLIEDINDIMKTKDMQEAQSSISYLEEQLGKTNLSDIKTVLYQLIEEQLKTMMLVKIRKEYIFKTIDPAVIPESMLKSKRSIIMMAGPLIGGFLGIFTVLLFNMYKKLND